MNIFETHAHMYFPQFENLKQTVLDCEAAGVSHQVQIGCDEISSLAALELAKQYPRMYATLGLHPCDVDKVGIKNPEYHRYAGFEDYDIQAPDTETLFQLFESEYLKNKENIAGFGETGFDAFYEDSEELRVLQSQSFIKHLKLADKYQKMIVIHTRGARDITLNFFKSHWADFKIPQAVVHCFCEDLDFAKIVTEKYGMYLGIGGIATYIKSEEIREVIKQIPLEFLVTETDSPFLVPNQARKKGNKVNAPQFIPEIITLIAELKNMETEKCADILFQNAKRLYSI